MGGSSGISKNPYFEREFRMEIDLQVSESEDFAEFPEVESVEKTSSNRSVVKKKFKVLHKKRTVAIADKSTQTYSRKVWRKKKKLTQQKH